MYQIFRQAEVHGLISIVFTRGNKTCFFEKNYFLLSNLTESFEGFLLSVMTQRFKCFDLCDKPTYRMKIKLQLITACKC